MKPPTLRPVDENFAPESTEPQTPMAKILAGVARIEERLGQLERRADRLHDDVLTRVTAALQPAAELRLAVLALEGQVIALRQEMRAHFGGADTVPPEAP